MSILYGFTGHMVLGKPQHSNIKQSQWLKTNELHFPQMMQVPNVFAAEHRKRAGDLRFVCLWFL